MNDRVEQLSQRFYRGLWGVLTRWFRVPDRPPTLPDLSGTSTTAFQPDVGFLRYLLFKFWVVLVIIDGAIFIGWLALTIAAPLWGAVLAVPALILAVAPDVVAYLAVHLRFDTTWYVMSDRSLRIRRGIWVIHETTLTFENVQNVNVRQGPLQRYFGIADLHIDTAGGGQPAQGAKGGMQGTSAHRGLVEGVADAERIRDLILDRLRRSRTAGLGDEAEGHERRRVWTEAQLRMLREIRDVVRSVPPSAARG